MAFFALLSLFTLSFQTASSTEVIVERGHKYDKVIWDGDCSKINAIHVAIEDEKMCECKKSINVNSIKSELLGFIFPDKDGFVKCYYDYRETGANLFLRYAFDSSIHIISDASFGSEFYLGENANNNKNFDTNTPISIKELRLYTFKGEKPFTKLENTFFGLKNRTYRSRLQYKLKVNTRVTRKLRGGLIQILFDQTDLETMETKIYGFVVVKFVGDTFYDLEIPKTSAKLKESKSKEYEIATFVLAGIATALIIIIILLIIKPRTNQKKNQKAVTSADELKDTHDISIAENNQQTFPGKRYLGQLEKNVNRKMKPVDTDNRSSHSNIGKKPQHVYESYGPANVTQSLENDVHVMGNDYYNDCY